MMIAIANTDANRDAIVQRLLGISQDVAIHKLSITPAQAHRLIYEQFDHPEYKKLIEQLSSAPIYVIRFTAITQSVCVNALQHHACYIISNDSQLQRADEIFSIRRRKRCIALIGPPASGKGSQCERLKSAYHIIHISTGELLRSHVKRNTDIGKRVASYMKRGELVPNSTIVDLTLDRCHEKDCESQGFILDGFPRNIHQAQRLLSDPTVHIDAVVHYVVEEHELLKRSTGRRLDPVTGRIYHIEYNPPTDPAIKERLITRSDDTVHVVQARLFQYQQTSQPILDVFAKHSVPILSIDATTSDIERIFNRTITALERLPSNHETHVTAKL